MKQSAGWNDVTKKFAENEDVMFGDINLSEGGPRATSKSGDHQAGAGGWPTVKYFNKRTGFQGSSYAMDDKKTDMPMCDELGYGEKYLAEYVMEKGKTQLCSSAPPFKGCSSDTKEKSQKLYDKAEKKKIGWIETKLEKVLDQKNSKLWPRYPEVEQNWIIQQIGILESAKSRKTAEL